MSYISNITETSENYDQYLQYIADLDMSLKEKYELLYIVHAILLHFVDTAFGVQTDQITLQSVGRNLKISFDDATVGHHSENPTMNAQGHGVESDSNPLERGQP